MTTVKAVTIDSILEVLEKEPYAGQAQEALSLINLAKETASTEEKYALNAAAGCVESALQYPQGADLFLALAEMSLKSVSFTN